MPTIPTHAVAAIAIGSAFPRQVVDGRWRAAGAVCAMLPDVDVIGFRLGVHYGDFLGHRGFSHSLVFAAVLALVVFALPFASGHRRLLWLFLFLATASHGLLDALTDGGLGVALFAPFDNSRYFFPVRPIVVSPIGLRSFFSGGGLSVILSEVVWVWLPSVLLTIGGRAWRNPG